MCLLSLSELAVMNFLREIRHFYPLKKEKFWWIVLISMVGGAIWQYFIENGSHFNMTGWHYVD